MITRRTFLISAAGIGVAAAFSSPLTALAQGRVRLGSFSGQGGHKASGTVEVSPAMVTLQGDFRFDGAPDPKVALGRNGYDPRTLLGGLVANSGRQSYRVPASIDPSGFNEVWIWCEEFDVPLAMARLG